ncbi:hypothetical protein [Anaerosporobacter sp.]|uniref:hypothetical protein n=1 Tax=Anaerosporobacter sp. TaxID=1872529 RepID=UPI00286F3A42|nr:hypothetical protein [Anaerosporobacter sp.]
MNKSIEGIMEKAANTFQTIHEVNTAVEQICRETKESEEINVSIEDECLNVKITVGENSAYTQLAMSEIYARVMKSEGDDCFEKILQIIGEGINQNIMDYANYAK